MSAKLPRRVKPSQLEEGDLITVEFTAKEGVTMTNSGRIATILAQGATRIAVTKENGRLLTWDAKDGFGQGLTITLRQRKPAEQVTLW